MKLKIRQWGLALLMLCGTYQPVHAEMITLNYDGKVQQYDLMPIKLYMNVKLTETTVMPPIQLDGRVLVPAREAFGALGAMVDWKSRENKVYIDYEDHLIVLEIGSNEAWVDGEIKTLDMPAKVINEKLMLPIRFISEALHFNVEWISTNASIYISTSEQITVPSNEGLSNGTIEVPSKPVQGVVGTAQSLTSQISYDQETETLSLNGLSGVSINEVTMTHLYRERKLVIDIVADNELIEESWSGSLGSLKGVSLSQGMTTQLIIDTSTVKEANLKLQDGELSITLMAPKQKYSKIIVLDAGHGGSDSGTTYGNLYEKDLTLKYSQALSRLLENNPDIKVYTTRDEDVYPTLPERVELSNEISPDLYISIHINSVPNNAAATGTETFYAEVATDTRGKCFAQMVQTALVETFDMRDRGIKDNGLYVTRNTNEPAVLIEAGFITNEEDRAKMTASDYAERYAQVVYNCILEYYRTI